MNDEGNIPIVESLPLETPLAIGAEVQLHKNTTQTPASSSSTKEGRRPRYSPGRGSQSSSDATYNESARSSISMMETSKLEMSNFSGDSPQHFDEHTKFRWQQPTLKRRGIRSVALKYVAVSLASIFVASALSYWALWASRLQTSCDMNAFQVPPAVSQGPMPLLQQLYASSKVPNTQDSVTAPNGKDYGIAGKHWSKPLRNQVLILDMDSRDINSDKELLHNTTVSWDKLNNPSSGLLNHYMYSLIHGYDYKFLRTNPDVTPGLFPSWAKPGSIADALKDYRFVVFMDSDAIWNMPEVPLEWLLNHWNVTEDVSLAMSDDWSECHTPKGQRCTNTGFIIAQQSDRTQEILRAWADCPNGKQFPGCEEWANKRVYDQAAFNNYLRNGYLEDGDLVTLSCSETDGSPGDGSGCEGVFIHHYWAWKEGVRSGFANTVMRSVTERLHGYFVDHRADLVEYQNSQ